MFNPTVSFERGIGLGPLQSPTISLKKILVSDQVTLRGKSMAPRIRGFSFVCVQRECRLIEVNIAEVEFHFVLEHSRHPQLTNINLGALPEEPPKFIQHTDLCKHLYSLNRVDVWIQIEQVPTAGYAGRVHLIPQQRVRRKPSP